MYLRRVLIRVFALTIACVHLTTSSVLARVPIDSNTLALDLNRVLTSLPLQYGTVRQIATPSEQNRNRSGKIVIHIQDVHMNPEAQRHIELTLQELINKQMVDLVALEGAFGPMNFSWYREPAQRNAAKAVADYLLKTKRISGPVHSAFASAAPIPLFVGIDEKNHYDANTAAVRYSAQQTLPAKRMLARVARQLAASEQRVFNSALAKFDAEVRAARRGDTSWSSHVRRLCALSQRHSVNMQLYLATALVEKSLSFDKVGRERAELLARLAPALNANQHEDFLARCDSLRAGISTPADFYTYLTALCVREHIDIKTYPSLDTYIRYLSSTERINAEQILQEADMLESQIYQALARTDAERALIRDGRWIYLTGKLVDFSLTKHEWNEYKRLDGFARIQIRGIDFSNFNAFYEQAEARDRAMADNLVKAMATSHADIAVTVAGGFHSDGLIEELLTKGITVVSFTPKITALKNDGGSTYLSVFTQQKTPLDALFAGEKLFLAPLAQLADSGLQASVGAYRVATGDIAGDLPQFPVLSARQDNGKGSVESTQGDVVTVAVEGQTIKNITTSHEKLPYQRLIQTPPHPNLTMSFVTPVYRELWGDDPHEARRGELKGITRLLNSFIQQLERGDFKPEEVELILVVNNTPEAAAEKDAGFQDNQALLQLGRYLDGTLTEPPADIWVNLSKRQQMVFEDARRLGLVVHCIDSSSHGVERKIGPIRNIGIHEAVARFAQTDIGDRGLIGSLDADVTVRHDFVQQVRIELNGSATAIFTTRLEEFLGGDEFLFRSLFYSPLKNASFWVNPSFIRSSIIEDNWPAYSPSFLGRVSVWRDHPFPDMDFREDEELAGRWARRYHIRYARHIVTTAQSRAREVGYISGEIKNLIDNEEELDFFYYGIPAFSMRLTLLSYELAELIYGNRLVANNVIDLLERYGYGPPSSSLLSGLSFIVEGEHMIHDIYSKLALMIDREWAGKTLHADENFKDTVQGLMAAVPLAMSQVQNELNQAIREAEQELESFRDDIHRGYALLERNPRMPENEFKKLMLRDCTNRMATILAYEHFFYRAIRAAFEGGFRIPTQADHWLSDLYPDWMPPVTQTQLRIHFIYMETFTAFLQRTLYEPSSDGEIQMRTFLDNIISGATHRKNIRLAAEGIPTQPSILPAAGPVGVVSMNGRASGKDDDNGAHALTKTDVKNDRRLRMSGA